MKKYHAAAVYFTRALAEGEKDTGGKKKRGKNIDYF